MFHLGLREQPFTPLKLGVIHYTNQNAALIYFFSYLSKHRIVKHKEELEEFGLHFFIRVFF